MLVTTATSQRSKPQTLAQHAAARRFQHGRVDVRVHQDVARTLRATAVAGVDALCPG